MTVTQLQLINSSVVDFGCTATNLGVVLDGQLSMSHLGVVLDGQLSMSHLGVVLDGQLSMSQHCRTATSATSAELSQELLS